MTAHRSVCGQGPLNRETWVNDDKGRGRPLREKLSRAGGALYAAPMSDPTMKDVLDAVTGIRAELDAVRRDMATKGDLARVEAKVDAVDAKVDAHRLETEKGFRELDAELSKHAGIAHHDVDGEIAKLEKRVAALEKRPARTTAARPARRR